MDLKSMPRRWLAGTLGALGTLALSGPLAAQQPARPAAAQAQPARRTFCS
jgi:hypothetical protein